MPLSLEHIERDPKKRQLAQCGKNKGTVMAQFNRADAILQDVLADIVSGLTKNEIVLKFQQQKYADQKKPLCERQAENYIKTAYLLMQEDRIKERDMLRDQFYSQYIKLYQDLVKQGNYIGAKQVLDSMTKLFLPSEDNKAQINISKEGIDISFGFKRDEEE